MPIPSAKPGTYGEHDRIHRIYYTSATCGGPSPIESDPVEGSVMVLHDVTTDCSCGEITDADGQSRELVAEINRARAMCRRLGVRDRLRRRVTA